MEIDDTADVCTLFSGTAFVCVLNRWTDPHLARELRQLGVEPGDRVLIREVDGELIVTQVD